MSKTIINKDGSIGEMKTIKLNIQEFCYLDEHLKSLIRDNDSKDIFTDTFRSIQKKLSEA